MCTAQDRQLLDSALGKSVQDAVQEKLDLLEPFTNACISHPLIEADSSVRHRDVKLVIAAMWRERMLVDGGSDVRYLRTPVTVYPDGASNPSSRANLFYPDNGYDPYTFSTVERILVRSDQGDNDADVDGTTITNTPTGASVTKQCAVQSAEDTLNVPTFLIKAAGWPIGENICVVVASGILTMKKRSSVHDDFGQHVDKEGRIRLHGTNASMFKGKSPVAVLVTPDGGDKYLQISPSNIASTAQPSSVWT